MDAEDALQLLILTVKANQQGSAHGPTSGIHDDAMYAGNRMSEYNSGVLKSAFENPNSDDACIAIQLGKQNGLIATTKYGLLFVTDAGLLAAEKIKLS